MALELGAWFARFFRSRPRDGESFMSRCRLMVCYEGRVQGVGFRYTTKKVALEFDVAGTVRNLADGRVELIAEGERAELEDFRDMVRQAGLAAFIRNETEQWFAATNEFRGFEIVG
jgi:acylphosphatase